MAFYNLHLPNEVRIFNVPEPAVLRWDDEAVVYEVLVGNGRALRHYALMDRWFEVNVSLTATGALIEEPHPQLSWTFNCDICTPPRLEGRDAYYVDLELDVLVSRDARRRQVVDERDFSEARRRGYFGPSTATAARAGLAELLALIDAGRFLAFLEAIYPLGTTLPSATQPPPRKVERGSVPMLRTWVL
jgi:hypothetical protein